MTRSIKISLAIASMLLLAGCSTPAPVEASTEVPETEAEDIELEPVVEFITPTLEPTEEPSPTASATPTAVPTPTATEQPAPESIVNVGSNLRDGPGTFYDIITGLVFGTVVQLEGRNEEADWVFISASQDREGWIFASLVDFTPEEIDAAPVREVDSQAVATQPPIVAEAPSAAPIEEPTQALPPVEEPPTQEPTEEASAPPPPVESSTAVSGNLLINGSFEEPYYRIATAEGGGAIATGWTAWWFNDAGDTYQVPEYEIAPLFRDANRVRTGNAAQQLFRPSTRWLAGVYQQVGVPEGSRLRLTIYGHAWSTFCIPVDGDEPICDARDSNREGRGAPLFMRVGIDSTGGTDAFSPNVVWSPDQVIWDNYAPFTVEATAAGGTVTVFTYGAPEFGAPINNAYWDDAELVIIQ